MRTVKQAVKSLSEIGVSIDELNRNEHEIIRLASLGKAFEGMLESKRLHSLGSANLGKPGYQLLSIELYTAHGSSKEELAKGNEYTINALSRYILAFFGYSVAKETRSYELCDLAEKMSEVGLFDIPKLEL